MLVPDDGFREADLIWRHQKYCLLSTPKKHFDGEKNFDARSVPRHAHHIPPTKWGCVFDTSLRLSGGVQLGEGGVMGCRCKESNDQRGGD